MVFVIPSDKNSIFWFLKIESIYPNRTVTCTQYTPIKQSIKNWIITPSFISQTGACPHLYTYADGHFLLLFNIYLAAMTYNQVHYFQVNHLADFTQNGHTKIPVG